MALSTLSQHITKQSVALLGLTAISGYYIFKTIYHRNKTPSILKLIVYPIKSLSGVEVDQLLVTETGVQFGSFNDRSYILLNEHGNMITQRTKPKLSLIKVQIDGDELWLDAPNMERLKISSKMDISKNEVVEFNVWEEGIKGIDCGPEIGKWFSDFLGSPTRLIHFVPGFEYRGTRVVQNDQVVRESAYPTLYQDGAQILLLNKPSIDDLNRKLDRNSKITYWNFRPNFVLNAGEAYDEDSWKWINFGTSVRLENVRPCTRCTLTTVIPEKGVKNPNGEPFKTLQKYRINESYRHLNKDTPLFGITLVAHSHGVVKLGDEVKIDENL